MTGLNFIVTILKMRAPGMTFTRMPLFVWGQFATAPLLMIATTALAAALAAPLIERQFGVPFFDPTKGGSPVHVAAHVLVLFASGRLYHGFAGLRHHLRSAAHLLPKANLRLQADRVLVDGDRVGWVHGLGAPHVHLGARAVLAGALHDPHVRDRRADRYQDRFVDGNPLSRKDSLYDGDALCDRLRGPRGIGGITGIFLAAIPFDLHVHGTYFIVGHIHYVLVGGSLMGIFAGMYYWFPKMSGRLLNETLGKIHFWLSSSASTLRFFQCTGWACWGCRVRLRPTPAVHVLESLESFASYLMTLSILIFFANAIWSIRNGKRSGPNPWGARTLEWQIPSPPNYYNFKHIPTVYGLPYDFSQALPYKGLEEELTDSPPPVAAGAH